MKSAIVADLADYRRADRNRIEAAIACGDKLALAKADMPHGAWIPFLKEIGLPARTASRWMAIRDWSVDAVEEAGGIADAAALPGRIKAAARDYAGLADAYRVATLTLCELHGVTAAELAEMEAQAEAEVEAESGVSFAELEAAVEEARKAEIANGGGGPNA